MVPENEFLKENYMTENNAVVFFPLYLFSQEHKIIMLIEH